MSERPIFWFAVKRYGWGWGLPVCWQGWVVFFGYLAALIGGMRYFAAQRAPASNALIYGAIVTVIFVVIVVMKGERPLHWRWGGK